MAKLDSISFRGSDDRDYDFRVYRWENEFKPLAAVYVVTERRIDPGSPPQYLPVFVGMTEDLSSVFQDHPQQECFDMYLANTIAVLPEPSLAARFRVVKALTEALSPPCNTED